VFERERASPSFGHDWTHNLTSFTGLQAAFRIPIECNDNMIGHCQFQAGFKLSAEDLPVRLSATTSQAIFYPSFRSRMPARPTALIWTKMSAPPASGWMNPKPFVALNHFTVPVARARSSRIGRRTQPSPYSLRGEASGDQRRRFRYVPRGRVVASMMLWRRRLEPNHEKPLQRKRIT
jgi:hypothetical protein